MTKGNCKHEIFIEEGKAYLANDDDSLYVQEFTAPQLVQFIAKLQAALAEISGKG